MLGKMWLQVAVNPMLLAFWVSALTNRPPMPTLPAPLSKGYKARLRP